MERSVDVDAPVIARPFPATKPPDASLTSPPGKIDESWTGLVDGQV
jgi:hypothetical protein